MDNINFIRLLEELSQTKSDKQDLGTGLLSLLGAEDIPAEVAV